MLAVWFCCLRPELEGGQSGGAKWGEAGCFEIVAVEHVVGVEREDALAVGVGDELSGRGWRANS
jgi:hypothetical protein